MKIKDLIEYGKNNLIKEDVNESYRLSRRLLSFILNVDDIYLVINSYTDVERSIELKYKEKIELLKSGVPIQYITNKQEFMGLEFYVDENVLIPQPDTEILVEEVLKDIQDRSKKYKILDLCTGSGAIGISIANNLKKSIIHMCDISEKALQIAYKNSKNNNVDKICKIIKSDMFENINEKYDVIVSNPPYIVTKVINNLSIEVQNEPHIALDGGEDGLMFYKIIANNAYKYLNKNGILALEIGYDQKENVIKLLNVIGKYENIHCIKDYNGKDRVIKANIK